MFQENICLGYDLNAAGLCKEDELGVSITIKSYRCQTQISLKLKELSTGSLATQKN